MPRTFRVLARAKSTGIFREGQGTQNIYELDGVPIRLIFRTRYLECGYQVRMPGDLWLDATGEARDLRTAARLFTNAGRDMASFLALGANAAISPLEPEIVLETTIGVHRREYLQRYLAPDELAYTSRVIDAQTAVDLIGCVSRNVHRDRLVRATAQYCQALQYWKVGDELLSLAHLFMGVEAIKVAMLRHYLSGCGISQEALAAEWGYDSRGRMKIGAYLEQEARTRLIFQGDTACYKLARSTSDSVEHGLSNAGALYAAAGDSLVLTARYLREAIVKVACVAEEACKILLGEKFSSPRGPVGIDRYIRSTMVGAVDDLATLQGQLPRFDWHPRIADLTLEDAGDAGQRYRVQHGDELTARPVNGMHFENLSYETWDQSLFSLPTKEGG